MRKHILLWAGATLALIITTASGCGGTSTTTSSSQQVSSCVNQSAPHHAYLVVVHESGSPQVVQRCVGFSTDAIDAATLMDRSGVEYQTQTFSFGKAVCQVDNEPARFSSCFADNGPNWNLFVDTAGQWTLAQSGYQQVSVRDKEAIGWVYSAAATPAPPPSPKE